MKLIYQRAYNILLETTKFRSKFIGCHKHRIIQGYKGGTYDTINVLYLTKHEHSLIHFILWKINGDFRDKRAYKMIGKGPSGLSHDDRIDHGLLCAKNKIGFHGFPDDIKNKWRNKGREVQQIKAVENNDKNWYYWSTKKGRKERASLGGKASYGKNKAFIKQQGSFKDKSKASDAAKKSAKKPVTNGKDIIKFHTEEQRIAYLLSNPAWRKGCPTKKDKLELVI